jgi:Leucine-rich repeat (LRR) protein
MKNLESLVLAGAVSMKGSISSNVGKLSNLKKLYLSGNDLQGTIPSEIGMLTGLEDLALAQNVSFLK